jgi:hypothetical protein
MTRTAVSCASTNLRVWFSAVVLVGVLAFVGSSWEGFDGRSPESTEPRLLTEDPTGWSVFMVRDREMGDCLMLRLRGSLVSSSCRVRSVLNDYQVELLSLPGTKDRRVFGMLPDLAARAEVQPLSGKVQVQVQVRTYGGAGRYVAEPVPASREGSDPSSNILVSVGVFDG